MATTLPAPESRTRPTAVRTRRTAVRTRLGDTDADAAAFLSATSIEYLTGMLLAVTPDTVAVTDDGTEQLTYHPRDLESDVVR